jgi:hypothetical protein
MRGEDVADVELDAMSKIYAALDPLEVPARERVLQWAASKFEVAASSPDSAQGLSFGVRDDGGPRQFQDLGDLMHAAEPANGPQRALVVAYWFQEVQGLDGWEGGDINSSLKNMGSGLANVTNTLGSLKARKPALVMQTAKSGRSRQARKTYKLTVAGVRAVKEMISNASNASQEEAA